MVEPADEPPIRPEQLRCGELAFVGVHELSLDEQNRTRKRIAASVRWWYAGHVALALAMIASVVTAAQFAVATLDPDGNRPQFALVLVFFGFVLLGFTVVGGTAAVLLFARDVTLRWTTRGLALVVALAAYVAFAADLEILGALAGILSLGVAALGVMQLLAVPFAELAPSRARIAGADVRAAVAWRFAGRCHFAGQCPDEELDDPNDSGEFVSILVLPNSAVTVDTTELASASLRPLSAPRSPYRSAAPRTCEMLESRRMLACERLELAVLARQRSWTALFAGSATLWVVALAGAGLLTHLAGLGWIGSIVAITVAGAVTTVTTTRRLRGVRALHRDADAGIVVVRVVSDPIPTEPLEWLPTSHETWTTPHSIGSPWSR